MVREFEQPLRRLEDQGFHEGAGILREQMSKLNAEGLIPDEIPVDTIYHHPYFDYDFSTSTVSRNGAFIQLTPIENQLFELLTSNPNRLVSHEETVGLAYGYRDVQNPSDLYKGYISNIRQKLSAIGVDPEAVLINVHGNGYYVRDNSLLANLQKDFEETQLVILGHSTFNFYPDLHLVKHLDGEEIELTALEARVLKLLMKSSGKIVTRQAIINAAWPPNDTNLIPGDEYNLIKTHMSHLRRKLKTKDQKGSLIKSKKGVGYLLLEEPQESPKITRLKRDVKYQLSFDIVEKDQAPLLSFEESETTRIGDLRINFSQGFISDREGNRIKLSDTEIGFFKGFIENGSNFIDLNLDKTFRQQARNKRQAVYNLGHKMSRLNTKFRFTFNGSGFVFEERDQ